MRHGYDILVGTEVFWPLLASEGEIISGNASVPFSRDDGAQNKLEMTSSISLDNCKHVLGGSGCFVVWWSWRVWEICWRLEMEDLRWYWDSLRLGTWTCRMLTSVKRGIALLVLDNLDSMVSNWWSGKRLKGEQEELVWRATFKWSSSESKLSWSGNKEKKLQKQALTKFLKVVTDICKTESIAFFGQCSTCTGRSNFFCLIKMTQTVANIHVKSGLELGPWILGARVKFQA